MSEEGRDAPSLLGSLSPELLEKLAARARLAEGDTRRPIRSQPIAEGEAAPLSFAQQRLWFLEKLLPQSPLYTIPRAVRLSGTLDSRALRQALGTLAERHEAIRTAFAQSEKGPVQVIEAPEGVPMVLEDLSHQSVERQEAEVRRLAREEARRPFDLAQPPLLRARLIRLGASEHLLLLMMHHIASDGWSMSILARELATAYRAHIQRRAPRLAPLPVRYVDYAVWQRDTLSGDNLEKGMAFWEEALAPLPPPLNLPSDRPRPATQSFNGGSHFFTITPGQIERLLHMAQSEGATLFMALLVLYQTLLYRHAGDDDIAVGTPVAGRPRPELEGLVGFFCQHARVPGAL